MKEGPEGRLRERKDNWVIVGIPSNTLSRRHVWSATQQVTETALGTPFAHSAGFLILFQAFLRLHLSDSPCSLFILQENNP